MSDVPRAPGPSAPDRVTSLNGLRGVASVVVLVHHALLTIPAFATAYYTTHETTSDDAGVWALTYTPLHTVWAGTEAVFLFFILSGIVLTFPVLRAAKYSWLAYYPRRIVRLYGPVIAAVLFGLILVLLVPRHDSPSLSAWINARPNEYSLGSILKDVTLVGGVSRVISPLWSLQWEVLFSLLLPVYILFSVRGRRLVWGKIALLGVVLVAAATLDKSTVFYLAMFAIGTLTAANWGALTSLASRLSSHRWAWPALSVTAILLFCSHWELMAAGISAHTATTFDWLAVLGSAVLIYVAAFWVPFKLILNTRGVQWLGLVSFSLYLVHEPIIIALRFVLVSSSPWLALVVSVPLSFVVAALFSRFVEQPLHSLAKAVGHFVTERINRGHVSG